MLILLPNSVCCFPKDLSSYSVFILYFFIKNKFNICPLRYTDLKMQILATGTKERASIFHALDNRGMFVSGLDNLALMSSAHQFGRQFVLLIWIVCR